MDRATLKILLVDGDGHETDELRQKLGESRNTNYSVEVAKNLQEGFRLLHSRRFDTVLMDLSVPGSAGIPSLREVIAKAAENPVVVISAEYEESQALETVRAGAQDYLVKTRLNSAALERILIYCIERQRGRRRTAMQYAASRVLAESQSVEQAGGELLGILCHFLDYDFGTLWNSDRWSDELHCFCTHHDPERSYTELEQATKQTRLSRGQELSGRAWAEGVPAYANALARDGDSRRALLAAEAGLQSGFAFPIIVGAENLGVIELLSRERQPPDEEMLKVATHIANQVGQFMARKLAEAEKEHLMNERLLVLDSASEGIYGIDLKGGITFMNRAAAKMFRCNAHEVSGKNSHQLFHHSHADGTPYAFADCPLWHVFASGEGHHTDKEHYWRTDGTHFAVDYSAFPVVEAGTLKGAVICFNDITDRKRMEVELRHAQKLEAVGGLAAGIAHEINTPIQFIGDNTRFLQDSFRGTTEMLKGYEAVAEAAEKGRVSGELLEAVAAARKEADWEYLREEVPKALTQMLDGIGRVAAIVRAMKEFSHVDRSAEKTPADINKALESTLVVARNELKYVADVKADYGALPLVMCHLGDLNQVFLNLLVNAAHAIGDAVKGTSNRGRITISTKTEGDWVEVAIADTGTGIPEAVRENIFEPFFTTKEVGKGTGQGLALARAIVVEKHGGTLSFQTEMGKGTTFLVRLPIQAVAEPQEAVAR